MAEQPVAPIRRPLYCNTCRGETWHVLCGEHKRSISYDEEGYEWDEYFYRLWTCAGCDTGTMEVARTGRGEIDEHGDQVYDFSFFPSRTTSDLVPKVFRSIPGPLATIYTELIRAFNADLRLLCAAGLRALIEGICQDKGILGRNLEERIDGLVKVLPKNIVDSLHGFRFMGNEALHELNAPDLGDLRVAVEVSEDLLNFLYELDYKASRLPRRKGAAAV